MQGRVPRNPVPRGTTALLAIGSHDIGKGLLGRAVVVPEPEKRRGQGGDKNTTTHPAPLAGLLLPVVRSWVCVLPIALQGVLLCSARLIVFGLLRRVLHSPIAMGILWC